MPKVIQLKLSHIKYSGDSIGDDIRAEIEVLGNFLRVDKRIRVGTTAEINREIGRFETDQKSLKLNAHVVIIEKDLLFNDVGGMDLEIKIDTTIAEPQPWKKTLYDIKIPDYYHRGGRYYLGRAKLAPVWFKTTHPSDSRYVHPGSYSLGCVTLTEIERWDELCKILLKARKGDFMSVGILEVTD